MNELLWLGFLSFTQGHKRRFSTLYGLLQYFIVMRLRFKIC